jgi:hypothetical protein
LAASAVMGRAVFLRRLEQGPRAFLRGKMKPDCPICFGIGWVCENHPDRPWDDELGCTCGAGTPCECNSAEGHEEPDISQVIISESEKPPLQ